MEYCKVQPGEDEYADAFNLMVSAWTAHHRPQLAREAETMTRAVCQSITDWQAVTAALAFLAAEFGNFSDRAVPDEVDGKTFQRPTDKFRLEIEKRDLAPA